ncbi:MAG: ergothioneine biosynthesis protein EgtB [Acidimicrobiales bacterium]
MTQQVVRSAAANGNGGRDVNGDLAQRYLSVRAVTESIAAVLSAEDQTVQSMPDVSPTKWHRAHTTWFFETFLLKPQRPSFREFHPRFGYLFNSYYEAIGERHPRAERGNLTRPGAAEVGGYRAFVDSAMVKLIHGTSPEQTALRQLVELGLQHEQQHQELLLMDIKHVFSRNPLAPAYNEKLPHHVASTPTPLRWTEVDGGLVEIGISATDAFAFDNEGPRHKVWLEPFRIADRLVTCGEWMDFIDDGGYRTPSLWLADGWSTVDREQWTAPLYWQRADEQWQLFTLGGLRSIDRAEPVVHVSYYEADAFARWAAARLPTEAEWERVAELHARPGAGNFLSSGRLHPASAARDSGIQQLYGDVWEWTTSAYHAYPGFTPSEGAVGEYNGKFMSGQMVLRGGCCVTPADHVRATYRNFFYPWQRWMFSGVRLAAQA